MHGSTFFVCTVLFSSIFFQFRFVWVVAIPPAVLECCAALLSIPRTFRWSKKLVSQNAFVISQWQSWNIKWTHRWSIHSIYGMFTFFSLLFCIYTDTLMRSTVACVNCTNQSAFALNDVCFNSFRFIFCKLLYSACRVSIAFSNIRLFSRASPLPPMRFYCCCTPIVRRVSVQR